MTARVKLSELVAARAAMSLAVFDYASLGKEANAAGLVATHNAADVLIEVVREAISLSAAEFELSRAWGQDDESVLEGCQDERDNALQRMRRALAKVEL